MSTELWQLDATEVVALTTSGQVSCREVVQSTLERLHAVNPRLNALTLALDDSALAAADAADRAFLAGHAPGALHGVPFTTKINTDHLDCPTDDGLVNFTKRLPREDSPLVARLRAAGAIAIGRNNSPALGLAQNASSALHGTTLNPWDPTIMCGGSSGGAAVAVATGMGPIAQGNDLGGSLRWPAFCCGVVGLRPSPGLIPYYNATFRGGMVFCEQLMTVHGPITRSVRDARLALSLMSGPDARDPVTVPVSPRPATGSMRVALVCGDRGPLGPLHPAVAAALRRAGEHLAAAGYTVEEVEPPAVEDALAAFEMIVGTEVSRLLMPLLDRFVDPLMEALVRGVAQRTADVSLDDYMAALRERDHIIRQWQLWMQTYPLVVLPSCTEPSQPVFPAADELGAAVFDTYERLRSLRLAPLLGFPALAVPVNVAGVEPSGRPLGVDIMAGRYEEQLCLAAGEAIEAREGVRRILLDPPALH